MKGYSVRVEGEDMCHRPLSDGYPKIENTCSTNTLKGQTDLTYISAFECKFRKEVA